MASKTFAQLASQADVQDADLLAAYRGTGPLKSVTALVLVAYLAATFLKRSNNLSDLADAPTARTNLGLGTAATHAATEFMLGANNLSDVASAATARGNLGAAPTASPVFTGGVTQTGSSKASVTALAALDIDWSANDVQTKAISSNSTFTFSNFTTGKAQSVTLFLTISSAAVPAWPASVKYGGGVNPSATLGNGTHMLQLTTPDGGTTVVLTVAAKAYA